MQKNLIKIFLRRENLITFFFHLREEHSYRIIIILMGTFLYGEFHVVRNETNNVGIQLNFFPAKLFFSNNILFHNILATHYYFPRPYTDRFQPKKGPIPPSKRRRGLFTTLCRSICIFMFPIYFYVVGPN
jgi:hypothetical protein